MKESKSVTQSVQDEFSKDTQGCFVAAILMFSFVLSLCFGFYLVWVIVDASLKYQQPADRSTAIKDALQILMTIGTLFSPLLAFVLGYYFNQSQSAHKADKSVVSNDAANQPDEKTGKSLTG